MLVKMSWMGGVSTGLRQEEEVARRREGGERERGSGRIEGRTGPRSLRAVSSSTFSMLDFEASRGRGRTMVALLPFSRSPMV